MTVNATANARTPGSSGGRDVGREVRREAAPPTGRRLPPCPADLLEPLHQPGGQSWRNVEQESLLLQLPQGRCKPVGQDLAVATPGTGTGVKPGDPLPRKAQSHHCTHWSLQMQMMGLVRRPPSALRRRPPAGTAVPPCSASCGPLRFKILKRTLMAAFRETRKRSVSRSPRGTQPAFLPTPAAERPTVGAPSISSMTRQLGLPPAPSTDSICVAASMRVRKASGLRSSLEQQGPDE